MEKLKSVGVREFRNNASAYLSGSDAIAINKHGHVIGFYIPIERDQDEVQRAISKLSQTVEKVLVETGISEEDLARMFDLRQQLS